MKDKKENRKFTIQLNRHNPLHVHVAGVLNSLKPRGKSSYLVEAILEYERCGRPKTDAMALLSKQMIDEKELEEIVRRVMHEMGELSVSASEPRMPIRAKHKEIPSSEVVDRTDDFESLDDERLNAIAEAASFVDWLKKR